MSGEIDGEMLRAAATEFDELERVARAADRFMQHIVGFELNVNGEAVPLMFSNLPEAIDLKAALDAWKKL